MATSIRYITLGEIELTEEVPAALDLAGISIPEATAYVSVFVDPDFTAGVSVIEPGASEVAAGEYIPAGSRWSDGPFLISNLPLFYSTDAGTIVVTLKPVVSER